MFDHDFYPTPPSLIQRLTAGIDWRTVADVLEPSAGKGDLCDAIKVRTSGNRAATIDAIELDPNLQHVLRGKGYPVVHDDFLSFTTSKRYDLIVANFPFSDGAAHLRKALSLLERTGGTLACLVNAETLRNPYTNERKAIAATLDDHDATVTYLADQFVNAERPTGVEVAMIRVTLPRPAATSLLLDGLRAGETVDTPGDTTPGAVTDTDPVRAMVARFDLECRAGVRLIEEHRALTPYLLPTIPKPGNDGSRPDTPIIRLTIGDDRYGTNHANEYIRAVRRKYWRALIAGDRFAAVYTSNVLTALDGHLERLQGHDFTLFNILALQDELRRTMPDGVEAAIIDMFDAFTHKFAYHDYSKNIHLYNGWRSNSAYKINRKIVQPINGFSSYSYSKDQLQTYYLTQVIGDLVKALNYLSGELVDPLPLVDRAIRAANEAASYRNVDFHYFTATFFKKGTCHITFTDQRLLDKLNIFGSRNRNWLPPAYGKRAYRDMDAEERAVVDAFQGEAAYNAVMRDPAYYLADPGVLAIADVAA